MATKHNFHKNYFLFPKCHLDIIYLILEKKKSQYKSYVGNTSVYNSSSYFYIALLSEKVQMGFTLYRT